jgi:phosphoglycerate dehydrogenase-like enzyme/predicted dehydrogenase
MSAKPPGVLVIGAGPAATLLHLPVLARLRDRGAIVLSQVCDLRPDRAATAHKRFGFLEQGGDAQEALQRPGIDAVYIFGSAQMHFEYGLKALQNGKHLFVEKPVAPCAAQARELAAAAKARGLIAAGGHNRRFYKSLAALQARAGKAGWNFAEAVFHKPECGKPPPFGATSWLSVNGIHALDALVFMMGGLPEHISACAGTSGTFSAVMRWADGATGSFLCNNNAGARREEYAFHRPGETCRVTEAGFAVEANGMISKTHCPSLMDGFAAEHYAFLKAIRSGIEPPHSIASLAPSLFLAELIESGFSGPVRLPEPQAQPLPRTESTPSILVVNPAALQSALARLLPQHRLVSPEDVRSSPNPRHDITAAIMGRGASTFPADLLDQLPQLSIVGIMGLSLSRHEPDTLLKRGIRLVNAPDAYADTVAEFLLGLAILGRRRAFLSDAVMRDGGWGTHKRPTGPRGWLRRGARRLRPILQSAGLEPLVLPAWRKTKPLLETFGATGASRDLKGATVGLIGWGANAQAFAARLIQAGAHVQAWSQHAAESDLRGAGAAPASLGEVLAADIVSLHRSLTSDTRHFLGAAELARLRPGTVLLNAARGALIEPRALLARLKQGDIFACLDTFQDEPPAASDPLRRLPNVFLTSHIAGGSPDMHAAAAEEVVRKVADWLKTGHTAPLSSGALA